MHLSGILSSAEMAGEGRGGVLPEGESPIRRHGGCFSLYQKNGCRVAPKVGRPGGLQAGRAQGLSPSRCAGKKQMQGCDQSRSPMAPALLVAIA